MEKKKIWSAGRIVALVACSLLPVLVLLAGCGLTIGGQRITFSSVIAYLLLPALGVWLCFLTIRSDMRVWAKSLLCIVILLLCAISILVTLFFGTFRYLFVYEEDELATNYTTVAEKNVSLPELDQVGDPVEMVYYEYAAVMAIFEEETFALKCQYDAEAYAQQTGWIEETYRFVTEPLDDGSYTNPPEVTVDGYRFRVFYPEDSDRLYYPKNLAMVATNDSTREIVYLYYCDWDLDFIRSLEKHIRKSCGFDLMH